MNTEVLQDQVTVSTGERLRQARKNMGLSEQEVAERLCLKVSTIRDIENDSTNPNLSSTFRRGYIRSYARLLHISEEELIPSMITHQVSIKTSKVKSIQNMALHKIQKNGDSWLMGFTWIIVSILLSLTGIWWWQNRQAQRQNITNIADKFSPRLSQDENAVSNPLGTTDIKAYTPNSVFTSTTTKTSSSNDLTNQPFDFSNEKSKIIHSSELDNVHPSDGEVSKKTIINTDRNILIMNFTDDCWLEVFDSDSKRLFSGIRHNGEMLNIIGKAPFKLKIGAPNAVQIQYQGKPIDLTQFIQSNQIAKITIAAKD